MKITTKAELIAHIAACRELEKDVPLFAAYDLTSHAYVDDCTIKYPSNIMIGAPIYAHDSEETLSEFLYVNGETKGSLKDRNIPLNGYNNHYWFTTKEEAEAHIRPKDFVVGEYYSWDIEKCWNKQKPAGQGGTMKCVYKTNQQGVFLQRDGNLCIIATAHLEYGKFRHV